MCDATHQGQQTQHNQRAAAKFTITVSQGGPRVSGIASTARSRSLGKVSRYVPHLFLPCQVRNPYTKVPYFRNRTDICPLIPLKTASCKYVFSAAPACVTIGQIPRRTPISDSKPEAD